MKNVSRHCALFPITVALASVAVHGAATPAGTKSPAASGDTVQLSAFEVKGTAGLGYRSTNTVTGTKSVKPLIDIPASVSIITRDFIDDMVSDQTIGDILKYAVAGAPPSTNRNNFLQIRGQRFESPWTDGIRVSNSPNELSVVESIEVLKGVNSVLYGTRVPPGGLVNRITKKPQTKASHSLKVMYGDYDFMRAEIDTTAAIPGTDDKFAYRFVGAVQDYAGYRGRRDQDAYATSGPKPRPPVNFRAASPMTMALSSSVAAGGKTTRRPGPLPARKPAYTPPRGYRSSATGNRASSIWPSGRSATTKSTGVREPSLSPRIPRPIATSVRLS